MTLLKVWWHCLWRARSIGHRMCCLHYASSRWRTEHFCECGYKQKDES